MKKLLSLSMLAAVLLAACGPQATPTMSPADVQATAFAAASTMVAQTQAAIPTATPIPPTETPSPTPPPTDTPPAPPTSSLPTLAATSAVANPGADPCNKPMASAPDGPSTTFKLDNKSSGQVNISLYLNKTPFGECGYRGYSVSKGGSAVITIPQGCYSAYAWINGNKPATVSGGGYCANNEDKWTLVIDDQNIKLNPP